MDDTPWAVPAIWASVTAVLIVITLTLDPLWAYYASWATGFATAFSVIRVRILGMKQSLLEAEDEALLLEVRQAVSDEEEERLDAEADPGGRSLPPPGDGPAKA